MHFMYRSRELQASQDLVFGQVVSSAILVVALVGVWAFSWFFPDFFNYSYMSWGGWDKVLRFWPSYAWVIVVSGILASNEEPEYSTETSAIFRVSILTSILAGIWEELAYRWIFICYAMILIVVSNWIFGAGIGWIITIAFTVGAIGLILNKEIFSALGCAIIALLSYWFATHANLIYWFYENVLVTVIHYTTLYQMDSVLYNGHDKLFLFGAIAANSWFRDGHKYQGWLGYINSWYIGMMLLYAALTYGLWTAIVVHIVYDILHGTSRLFFRPKI